MNEKDPQNEGPALSADGKGVYVAWAAGDNSNTLTAAYYNGSAVTCRTAFPGVTTAHTPTMAVTPTGVRYLAWVDPTNHIDIARLDSSACATTNTTATLTNRTLVDAPGSATGPTVATSRQVAWLFFRGTDGHPFQLTGTPSPTPPDEISGLTCPSLSH